MLRLLTLTDTHSYAQNLESHVFRLTKIWETFNVESLSFAHVLVLLMNWLCLDE